MYSIGIVSGGYISKESISKRTDGFFCDVDRILTSKGDFKGKVYFYWCSLIKDGGGAEHSPRDIQIISRGSGSRIYLYFEESMRTSWHLTYLDIYWITISDKRNANKIKMRFNKKCGKTDLKRKKEKKNKRIRVAVW